MRSVPLAASTSTLCCELRVQPHSVHMQDYLRHSVTSATQICQQASQCRCTMCGLGDARERFRPSGYVSHDCVHTGSPNETSLASCLIRTTLETCFSFADSHDLLSSRHMLQQVHQMLHFQVFVRNKRICQQQPRC